MALCGSRRVRSASRSKPRRVTAKGASPSGQSVRWTKAPPTRRDFFWSREAHGLHALRRAAADPADGARVLRRRDRAVRRRMGPHARRSTAASSGSSRASGFLGAGLPEEHGGMGLDMRSYALVVEELGRADSNVRGIVSVSNGLYGDSVAHWGTDEQRARLLPPLATGEELGCYALTEPGAGSDPGSLETRAERDGDGWRDQRTEDLHHARLLGDVGARLRTYRRARPPWDHVLRRPDERRRFRGASDQGQARPSRAGHRRALPRRRARPRRCRARRAGRRVQGRDVGARPRPHLARRGLRRHRAGLPRRVDRVHEGAAAVRAQRRELPARAGAARGHRRRDGGGTAPRVAGGGDRRSRRAPHRRGVVREVLRLAKSRCARRTRRCRRTAGTATSTSTRSASICATRV